MAEYMDDVTFAQREFADHGQKSLEKCEVCGFKYRGVRDRIYLHGYKHRPQRALYKMAYRHREHILQPFELDQGLRNRAHRSFNVPLQANQDFEDNVENVIGFYLMKIRQQLNCAFKVKIGVSRILMSRDPVDQDHAPMQFFRAMSDGVRERLDNGTWDHVNVTDMDCQDVDGCAALHPYTITNVASVFETAETAANDIQNYMINDRPDSSWQYLISTNLRFYCFLLPFAGGHLSEGLVPEHIKESPNIMDCVPSEQRDRQLCMFWCLVKHFWLKRKENG